MAEQSKRHWPTPDEPVKEEEKKEEKKEEE